MRSASENHFQEALSQPPQLITPTSSSFVTKDLPKLHSPGRTRMQNAEEENKNQEYANGLTSAARYSRTAAKYTGAPAPIRVANLPALMSRAILPTGNCNPALVLRETTFLPTVLP
jgi:hypothetical protein